MRFGYARVSTQDQDLAAQKDALIKAGCERLYAEKISGAQREREQLNRMLVELQAGDVVIVTRLDRLARSTLDLLTILDTIAKRGAEFKSLADSWADTTTPHGRLMLTILGGLAEFERSLILARTSEGRKRAKYRGVKFGRKPKLSAAQFSGIQEMLASGQTWEAVTAGLDVSPRTLCRLKLSLAAAVPSVPAEPCIPAIPAADPT